ncbi:MAG: high-potential iron-sulfur protein [Sedimenticolaceae bacterium]
MQPIDRRKFLFKVAAGACALATAPVVTAEADPDPKKPKGKLTETDGYARSMGFKTDTTRVDQKRYKKHTVDQSCSKCQLFKGEEGAAEGPCSFFGHRIVPATGWCRNFKPRKA